jgi:hypothetical protein
VTCTLSLQLYELDGDPKRKEFLDDLFSFMQKRGESTCQGVQEDPGGSMWVAGSS